MRLMLEGVALPTVGPCASGDFASFCCSTWAIALTARSPSLLGALASCHGFQTASPCRARVFFAWRAVIAEAWEESELALRVLLVGEQTIGATR